DCGDRTALDSADPSTMPSPKTVLQAESQIRAAELFKEGGVIEASHMLSEAIAEGETAELWNDWAVVQIGLAERALRRTLEMEPGHAEAAANLGILLFSTGN